MVRPGGTLWQPEMLPCRFAACPSLTPASTPFLLNQGYGGRGSKLEKREKRTCPSRLWAGGGGGAISAPYCLKLQWFQGLQRGPYHLYWGCKGTAASRGCRRGGDRQGRSKRRGTGRSKLTETKKPQPQTNIAWEVTTPTQPAPKKESRGREERHGGRSRVGKTEAGERRGGELDRDRERAGREEGKGRRRDREKGRPE